MVVQQWGYKMEGLINKYRTEQFYFSTPGYELLVDGKFRKIICEKTQEIPHIITGLQKSGTLKGKIVVGTLPFNINEAPILYLAEKWKKQEFPFMQRKIKFIDDVMKNDVELFGFNPTPEKYKEMVRKATEYIKKGELNKLVLSRGVELQLLKNPDIKLILLKLYQNNEEGYTYSVPIGNRAVLLGASPEMLVSKRGNSIFSNPLAGSRKRGSNISEDSAMAKELKESLKDKREHKFVVDNIVEKISEICDEIYSSPIPEVISTKRLWHLSSVIRGRLKNTELTALDAALKIYPTPAVCGVPQEIAYEKILELEGQGRGFFTGLVGWCDENGNGDWAIAIRGAEIRGKNVTIKAGAGIVEESVPEEEMKETGVKFRTMLDAIGIGEDKKYEY